MVPTRLQSTEPSIVIPSRIARGPTDILRALRATVSTDYTAPHYKFHDDPWLIPYKNYSKRDYALAKEAGRNAARYIQNRHPDLFEENRIYAEPPITAFQPRAAYNKDNVTLELLDNLLSCHQVSDSIAVYNLLKDKGKQIPVELSQSLLELVAFHNEEESVSEGFEARGVVSGGVARWVQGGLAEKIYSEGGLAREQARLTMLLGYAKWNNKKGARQMWDECQANLDTLPVEAYNAFISTISGDTLEKKVSSAKESLKQMANDSIQPDTDTLIEVLKLISTSARGQEYRQSCKYALDFLAEFSKAGVTISLGVYKLLLDIYVDTRGRGGLEKSNILADIMKQVEGKEVWPAKTNEDFWFFPTAMKVALATNKSDLSWEVNELLMTGDNISLLNSHDHEVAYYTAFLTNVLQNDSFETAIELYNKVCPHLWCPTTSFYKTLLSSILSHGAMNHLGKVYDDLVLSDFAGSGKEANYELNYQVLQILAATDPEGGEFSGLAEVWLDIARRAFNHLEANINNKSFPLRFNTMSPHICNLCAKLNLKLGSYKEAIRVFDFCRDQLVVMPGQLEEENLQQLVQQSVNLADTEKALEVVKYALDSNTKAALNMGSQISQKLELTSQQQKYLDKLFANDTQWIPLQGHHD